MANANTIPHRVVLAHAGKKRRAATRYDQKAAQLRAEADQLEAEYRSFMASKANV